MSRASLPCSLLVLGLIGLAAPACSTGPAQSIDLGFLFGDGGADLPLTDSVVGLPDVAPGQDIPLAPDGAPGPDSPVPSDRPAPPPDGGPGGDLTGADVPNTCGANLDTDPQNCGRCGHSCLDGDCFSGRCGSFEFHDANSSSLEDIATDGTYVFWTDSYLNTVFRSTVQGGAPPRVLASNQEYADALALDDTTVYWTRQDIGGPGGISKVAKVGGDPVEIYIGGCRHLTASGPHIYAACGADLLRMDKDGGNVTPLVPGVYPTAVAVSGDEIFWLSWGTPQNSFASGNLSKRLLSGGEVVLLSGSQASPRALAVDETSVYWTYFGTSQNRSMDGAVLKVPRNGGPEVPLVEGLFTAKGLAIDDQRVYFTSPDGHLVGSVLKQGGGVIYESADPYGTDRIAVDSEAAYFTTNGVVFKWAK